MVKYLPWVWDRPYNTCCSKNEWNPIMDDSESIWKNIWIPKSNIWGLYTDIPMHRNMNQNMIISPKRLVNMLYNLQCQIICMKGNPPVVIHHDDLIIMLSYLMLPWEKPPSHSMIQTVNWLVQSNHKDSVSSSQLYIAAVLR